MKLIKKTVMWEISCARGTGNMTRLVVAARNCYVDDPGKFYG
jgi:hypothetical protein